MNSTRYLWLFLLFPALLTGCQNKAADSKHESTAESTWRVIGPGGGGGVFRPTISPFDENMVMTNCDMTAAYLSRDGGVNWTMKNLWTVPEDFEFDPADKDIIYAATRGYRHSEDRGSGLSILYKSVNQGESWRIVYPDVEKAKKLEHLQNTDFLPSEIIEGALDGTIDKVEVDPADNRHIYMGLAPLKFYIGSNQDEVDSAMLVHSANGGQDWDLLAKLPGTHVKAIFPLGESGHEKDVIIFTESACVRVNRENRRIATLPLPVDKLIVVEGGRSGKEDLIYIQSAFPDKTNKTKGGMYVSRDLGLSWTPANDGLFEGVPDGMTPAFRRGLAVCESQANVAYISTINPVANDEGEIEYIYCIFKTLTGGEAWKPVMLSSTPGGYITDNFEGSWMEEKFDPGWGGSPIDLGVAPQNPDLCYAGDNGRAYRTTDGGLTWKQVYSHNQPDGSYASGGLDVTTCYGVIPDPFDKEHYFICYTDIGLFHSFNGGESWFQSITNIPRPWQNTCYDLTFDPQVQGKVWSVWANAHDLPRTKMFGRRGFDHFQGGVAVSDDGGLNWRVSNKGIPENAICTNILVDESSPEDARTLYVTVFDKGVYKSTNGGANWEKANKGLGDNLFTWELRQNSKGRLFLLCARGTRDEQTVDGQIYYSDDSAGTWTELSLPEGVNGPHDLQIDPDRPQTMYVCCWPRKDSGKDSGEDSGKDSGEDSHGGVIKTTDGGKSWNRVFDERIRVNSAGLDPTNSATIFINTFQNAAYRSDDAGETWSRLEGYRFKWGQKAIPDVNNPGMLFLSTYGGSVYYGPATGTRGMQKGNQGMQEGNRGPQEDIENMPEGWW